MGGGSAKGLAGCECWRPMLRAAALRPLCTGWWKRPSVVGGTLMCSNELLLVFQGTVHGGLGEEGMKFTL